ncbi:hypothetical protein FGB62_130g148 [Gracilaria domingensis]|nr:hypothetical protein FGB62_130g148 [Gracilaria domingensis]
MNPSQQTDPSNSNPSPHEQHSAVHKLVKCMRRWVAYEDNDGHTFYAYQIVSSAVKSGCFPSAVNELMTYLQDFPITFEELLRSLYSLSPGTENEWQEIGQTLNAFYDPRPYHEKENTWRLENEVKSLDLVYRKVENDIDRLESQLGKQKEILRKLKEAGFRYEEMVARRGPRKIPLKPGKPMIKIVEDAKQECFTRIYQRTRELCRYEDETVHFYHAFKLVDLFYMIIEKEAAAYTAYEKQRKAYHFAEKLEKLTRIYVEPLEEILKFVDTRELITLVLRKPRFSDSTEKVLSAVWNEIQRNPLDLDYEQTQGRLIPRCMGHLMLGPHVYKLMRARGVIADHLYVAMTKNAAWKKFLLECMQIGDEPSHANFSGGEWPE